MLHRLILKVTKFQLPPPKRLSTVVKNILGAIMPPCQIGSNIQTVKMRSLTEGGITMSRTCSYILFVVIGL